MCTQRTGKQLTCQWWSSPQRCSSTMYGYTNENGRPTLAVIPDSFPFAVANWENLSVNLKSDAFGMTQRACAWWPNYLSLLILNLNILQFATATGVNLCGGMCIFGLWCSDDMRCIGLCCLCAHLCGTSEAVHMQYMQWQIRRPAPIFLGG